MNEEILALLASEDPACRRAALEEMMEDNPKDHLQHFLKHLKDESVGVQEVCIDALIDIKSSDSIGQLIDNLYTENVPLRNASQEILSKISHVDIDQMLEHLYKDDDVSKFILDSLVLNIANINFTTEHITYIKEGLQSSNDNIVGATIEILGELNNEEAWNVLFEECKKENEWIQYSVLKTLSAKAPERIEKLYDDILQHHQTPSVTMFMKTLTK